MGHSTNSGRTVAGGRTTLSADERNALQRQASNGDATARNTLAINRNNMRSAADTIDSIYTATRDSDPAETVDRFVRAVGEDRAMATIASLVNRSAWDGRISSRNASWARGVTGAYNEDEANRAGISTRMHLAHLDQIADAMRRRRG